MGQKRIPVTHSLYEPSPRELLQAQTTAPLNADREIRKHVGTKKGLNDLWDGLQTPAVRP